MTSELSEDEPRVDSLEFVRSLKMDLVIAVSRIEVGEHTNLNFPVLGDASSFGVQPGVLVTKSIQLLNSQLTLVLIKDYHIVIVWIETSPIVIVRPHVSPTRTHNFVNYGRLPCVSLPIDPSMFALLRWVKRIIVSTCRYLLNLLFFEDLIIDRKVLPNPL